MAFPPSTFDKTQDCGGQDGVSLSEMVRQCVENTVLSGKGARSQSLLRVR